MEPTLTDSSETREGDGYGRRTEEFLLLYYMPRLANIARL